MISNYINYKSDVRMVCGLANGEKTPFCIYCQVLGHPLSICPPIAKYKANGKLPGDIVIQNTNSRNKFKGKNNDGQRA